MKRPESGVSRTAVSLAMIAAIGAGCTSEDKPKADYDPLSDCTKAKAKPLSAVHIEGSNNRGELKMINDGMCVEVLGPDGAKSLGYIATNTSFEAICSLEDQNLMQVRIGENQLGVAEYAVNLTDTQTGDRHNRKTPIIRAC